jgi:hypothetical protein
LVFPSIHEVKLAKRDRLVEWHRKLTYPTDKEQFEILALVVQRCAEFGFPDAGFNELARQCTAIHEAAHAVTAVRLEIQIIRVEIKSPENGECEIVERFPPVSTVQGVQARRNSVAVDMAGQLTEFRFCKQGFRRLCSYDDD